MRTISYTEALREALREELSNDESVLLMGEDIAAYGGAFGVTRGLAAEFGSDRVMDTPISEPGFVGAAVGAALTGMRPVVEIMFMDFMTLTIDQLVNQAAKLRYVFGRQARCPLVVRTAVGAGKRYGPTHSQDLTAWFVHAPGIKVVAPSTPADARGMLKAAIRDNNPVVFLEHKLLYGQRGQVDDSRPVALEGARVVRPGTDITLVAWSRMCVPALEAAAELAGTGIEAEVIDMRCLSPLDTQAVVRSVEGTGRLLIVEEACRTGGVSAEIGFRVFEEAYDCLDAPIRRVTAPDVPVPASPVLEDAVVPGRARIVGQAVRMVEES